jgi:hypothetical protein
MNNIELGNIFYYNSFNKDLILLNNEYISTIKMPSVADMLKTIQKNIIYFEKEEYKHEQTACPFPIPTDYICFADDIVFKFITFEKWRQGTCYICMQLSNKNNGSVKLTAYTTDTINHNNECFNTTTLTTSYVHNLLLNTLYDSQLIINSINMLKNVHSTTKSVDELLDTLVI